MDFPLKISTTVTRCSFYLVEIKIFLKSIFFLQHCITSGQRNIASEKLVKCPNFDLSGDNLIEMLTQPKVRDETDGKKKDDKDDDDDDEDDDKDDKDDKKESKLIYFLTFSIVDNSPCREEG